MSTPGKPQAMFGDGGLNAADVIRDALARVVRAREALEDGDTGFAYSLLTDLEIDLAGVPVEEAA